MFMLPPCPAAGPFKGHHCIARAAPPVFWWPAPPPHSGSLRHLTSGPSRAPPCSWSPPASCPHTACTVGHCHLSHGTGIIELYCAYSDVMCCWSLVLETHPTLNIQPIPHTTFIITTLSPHCPTVPWIPCLSGWAGRKCSGRGGEQSGAAVTGNIGQGGEAAGARLYYLT